MKIILIFSLFSLVFVQTFLPLQLYGQSVVPSGMDASQIQDWKRTNSVKVSPTPQSASSGVVAPTSSGFETGMGAGTTYSDTSGAPQVAKFSNSTNTWVSFILNLVVMFALKSMLGIIITGCSIKSIIFSPSLDLWFLVTFTWFAATVAFMVSFLVLSNKMADEFVYDSTKKKDSQIKAVEAMIDNAKKLKMLMLAQLAVFTTLTVGLQGVAAMTAIGCGWWAFAKNKEREATVTEAATLATFTTNWAAWKTAYNTFAGLEAPTGGTCPTSWIAFTAQLAFANGLSTQGAIVTERSSPEPLAMPPLPSLMDNAYSSELDAGIMATNTGSSVVAGKALINLNEGLPLLQTGLATIGPAAVKDDVNRVPPLCVPLFSAPVTTLTSASTALLTSSKEHTVAVTALYEARKSLTKARKKTMLDCGMKLGTLGTVACTAGAFVVEGQGKFPSCPFGEKPSFDGQFWANLLFSRAYALDTNTILMGVFGLVAYGVSTAIQAVVCFLYKANVMPVGPHNLFINPCFRTSFLQMLVLVAAAMDYFMYRSYDAVSKRLTDLENLLKQIKNPTAATSQAAVAVSGGGVGTTGLSSQTSSGTGGEGAPSLSSSSTASSSTFIPRFSTQELGASGSAAVFGESLSAESFRGMDLNSLNGNGCLKPSNDGFGTVDRNCECAASGSCLATPVTNSGADLGNESPVLQNDFQAVQNGLRSIGNSFARGDIAGATRQALSANWKDSARRLVALKERVKGNYMNAQAKNKQLPDLGMDFSPEEVKAQISGIKNAAGKSLQGTDLLLGSAPVDGMSAGDGLISQGYEGLGGSEGRSGAGEVGGGGHPFSVSGGISPSGNFNNGSNEVDPFKDLLKNQAEADQAFNQEQAKKGQLGPKVQGKEDPSVITRPNDSLFNYLSRHYLHVRERLGLK